MFDTNEELALKYVSKLKQCIYESYIYNLAKFNEEKDSYVVITTGITISHINSIHYKLYNENYGRKPLYIIPLIIYTKKIEGFYRYASSQCSVLDNFVDIDETFTIS
jgi:hypothetical protein